MNPFGISDKSYKLIYNTFTKIPDVEEVIVFGSRAKGTFKNGSDIDFAIKGKGCDTNIAMNLSSILYEVLPIPYFVDVVCYAEIDNPNLKEHIDRVGKIFYSNSE